MTGRAAPLSAAEFILWTSFRAKYGLDTDRVEWATANAGSALCHAWGAKVESHQIVPRFGGASRGASKKKLLMSLAGLRGATVEFTPNDPTKPKLTGDAALAELDKHDDFRPDSPRLLSEGKRPEKPERRKTLGGD